MTELMDLPSELLSVIVTFLAISSDGGRDLVRASATCKEFLNLARRPTILRVTNCLKISLRGFCEPHHHMDGLLSRCVRAGNPTAEHMLAMAVLLGGSPLWTEITTSELQLRTIKSLTGVSLLEQCSIAECSKTGSITDLPYILFCSKDDLHIYESYRRLLPLRLLRFFIMRASSRLLHMFYRRVEEFIVYFVGYERAHESGIVFLVNRMCLYEHLVARGIRVREQPSFKEELLVRFDRLFLAGMPS